MKVLSAFFLTTTMITSTYILLASQSFDQRQTQRQEDEQRRADFRLIKEIKIRQLLNQPIPLHPYHLNASPYLQSLVLEHNNKVNNQGK